MFLAERSQFSGAARAFWLMPAICDAIPAARDLAKAEFATLCLKLIKIAARVVEMANRVRLAPPLVPRPFSSRRCPPRSCRADLERRGKRPRSRFPSLQRVQQVLISKRRKSRTKHHVRVQHARSKGSDHPTS
jgi:hypothetical protein